MGKGLCSVDGSQMLCYGNRFQVREDRCGGKVRLTK